MPSLSSLLGKRSSDDLAQYRDRLPSCSSDGSRDDEFDMALEVMAEGHHHGGAKKCATGKKPCKRPVPAAAEKTFDSLVGVDLLCADIMQGRRSSEDAILDILSDDLEEESSMSHSAPADSMHWGLVATPAMMFAFGRMQRSA